MGWVSFILRAGFRRAPVLCGRILRLSRYEMLTVVRESEVSGPQDLKTYKRFPVVRAWWADGQLGNLSDEFSDSTHFYRFREVALSANRRGGFLRSGGQLIIPGNGLPGSSRVYFANSHVGGIVDQVEHHVLTIRAERLGRLERGIFAGSMAPHNWFHWIIDNLSTLYQARFLPEEFRDYPLLVPLEAKKRENWLAALDIVSGGREIVFVEDDRWFQVDDLVRIEAVTRPNPRPLLSRQRARIGVMAAPLLDYRNFVLAQLGLDLVGIVPGRRLFIGRKPSGARGYNQEEVFTVAEAYGFERVFLEDLTFEDSIRVFREAELIAGPHGAGWANMLFCHPATKAMLWTWEGEEEDNWYENIAFVAAVDYLQLSVSLVDKRGLDRRVADYHLDPSVFEQGLRALLARPSSVARR